MLWADKKLCLALWSAFPGHLYLTDQKSGVLGSCIYTPEADSGCPWSGAVVCGVCPLLLNGTRLGWEWPGRWGHLTQVPYSVLLSFTLRPLAACFPLLRLFGCFWGQAFTAAVLGPLRYLRGHSLFWKDDLSVTALSAAQSSSDLDCPFLSLQT